VRCLDEERLFQEQTLARFKETLHGQKMENQTLMERVSQLEGVEVQLTESVYGCMNLRWYSCLAIERWTCDY